MQDKEQKHGYQLWFTSNKNVFQVFRHKSIIKVPTPRTIQHRTLQRLCPTTLGMTTPSRQYRNLTLYWKAGLVVFGTQNHWDLVGSVLYAMNHATYMLSRLGIQGPVTLYLSGVWCTCVMGGMNGWFLVSFCFSLLSFQQVCYKHVFPCKPQVCLNMSTSCKYKTWNIDNIHFHDEIYSTVWPVIYTYIPGIWCPGRDYWMLQWRIS